jgi:hypothetical protein
LENLDGNLLLLMSARKKKKSKTACYLINFINFDLNNLEKYKEVPIAKLKSNLLGTNFSLYDFGIRPPRAAANSRASLAAAKRGSSSQIPTGGSAAPLGASANGEYSSASLAISENSTTLNSTQKSSSIDMASDQSDELTTSNSKVFTDNDNSLADCANTAASLMSLQRKEFLSVSYEINVLGVKGPRQMSVIIPGMDEKFSREEFYQLTSTDTLANAWKKIETNLKYQKTTASSVTATATATTGKETNLLAASSNQNLKSNSTSKLSSIKKSLFQLSRTTSIDTSSHAASLSKSSTSSSQKESFDESITSSTTHSPISKNPTINGSAGEAYANSGEFRNVVKLVNKSPEWHKELHSFALNFNGRVTLASVKNFQIVHEINTDYVVMQFGKVSKDLYTCDFSYPFCALQAFGVAITSLDNKLGCD